MWTRSGELFAFCSKSCLSGAGGRACLQKANRVFLGVRIPVFAAVGAELRASVHVGGAPVFNAVQDKWRAGRRFHNSCQKHIIWVGAWLLLWSVGSTKARCHKAMIAQSGRCQHGLRLSMPAFTCRMLDDWQFFFNVLCYLLSNMACKGTSQSSQPDVVLGLCSGIWRNIDLDRTVSGGKHQSCKQEIDIIMTWSWWHNKWCWSLQTSCIPCNLLWKSLRN